MNGQVAALGLQWDEITRGLKAASEELLGKLSIQNVLSHSWEAGGIYPTILGYALGAVATLALCSASHWSLQFPPAALCLFIFVQTFGGLESSAFAFLLAFAAVVGVGCTYVQVLSWQEAFASIAQRRKLNKKRPKHSKVDKSD